jgi:transcriptional regulator with XRE-family HTH domain
MSAVQALKPLDIKIFDKDDALSYDDRGGPMPSLKEIEKEYDTLSESARHKMQKAAIDSVLERDMPVEAVADYLGVHRGQVWNWSRPRSHKSSQVARRGRWAKIIYLSRLKTLPVVQTKRSGGSGRVSIEEQEERRELMKRHGLWPPQQRSRTMRSLREKVGGSLEDFSKRLGISAAGVRKLSNPENTQSMSPSSIDNIVRLKRELAETQDISGPQERYLAAKRNLIGWACDDGFPARSQLRAKAVDRLAERMKCDARTARRYLDRMPGRESQLRQFETAAEEGLLLPEFAVPPRDPGKKRVRAAQA